MPNIDQNKKRHDIRSSISCLKLIADILRTGQAFDDKTKSQIISRLLQAHDTLDEAFTEFFGATEENHEK